MVFSDPGERGVREIVAENLPEAAAVFGHGLCAPLTQADAVPLTSAFQDRLPAFLARGEVVAGHGIPPKTPVYRESSGFAFSN
jgi:hypothetical protein